MDGFSRKDFSTEAEAIAFIEGLEYVDNDHVSAEPPYEENDRWVVEIREFA